MSITRPLEQVLLASAEKTLTAAPVDAEDGARLEVLEAVASRVGGWSLDAFRVRRSDSYLLSADEALMRAAAVIDELDKTPIPIPLALCSLARPRLTHADRRREGVYYTDFRIATYVATQLVQRFRAGERVVDPAAGTGILLTALGLASCGSDRMLSARYVGESVHAADLSPDALRGSRLALASLTDSLDAIDALDARLRIHDSLLEGVGGWADLTDGFDLVVGNPPWEKVKATSHEYLTARGHTRHYGADMPHEAGLLDGFSSEQSERFDYASQIADLYPHQGLGEPDLYKAFIELSLKLAGTDGQLGLVVPAGLIPFPGNARASQPVAGSGI